MCLQIRIYKFIWEFEVVIDSLLAITICAHIWVIIFKIFF